MGNMSPRSVTVAEFLSKQIDKSGLTQREIAERVGYAKPNVISMMKLGQTKIPVDKAPAFAKALGVDPAHFMGLVLQEYMPEVWKTLEDVFGEALTDREKAFVAILREVDPTAELKLDDATIALVGEVLRKRQSGGKT
jgi:transcriptional regulator with XRE-family HTH domain